MYLFSTKFGTIIPTTLPEAVKYLDLFLSNEDKAYLKSGQEEAAIYLHSSLGRFLRNKWKLWSGSELARHMKDVYGIEHPDAMSHAILVAYCHSLVK